MFRVIEINYVVVINHKAFYGIKAPRCRGDNKNVKIPST
jgi:hypothetical protein